MSRYVDKLDYISLARLQNSALSDTSLTACSITLFFQIPVYKIKSNLSLGKVVRTLFPKKQRSFSSPFWSCFILPFCTREEKLAKMKKHISQRLIPSPSLKLRTAERNFMILNSLAIPLHEFQKYNLFIFRNWIDYLAPMSLVYFTLTHGLKLLKNK